MLILMQTSLVGVLIAGLFPAGVSPLETNGDSAFHKAFGHYESARLELTKDTRGGIPAAARAIGEVLADLEEEWSPEAAGIRPESENEIRELVAPMQEAASNLADAATLEGARAAFYELSKSLVRWRQALVGEKPAVAFCSMKKRSWLQPRGELTNPYYGKEMLSCGETVDD